MKREADFTKLLDNINPEALPSHSHSLRAAAYYVQGLQCFFQARYNEAKCVSFSFAQVFQKLLRNFIFICLYSNIVFHSTMILFSVLRHSMSFEFLLFQALSERDVENGQRRRFEPVDVVFTSSSGPHLPVVRQQSGGHEHGYAGNAISIENS